MEQDLKTKKSPEMIMKEINRDFCYCNNTECPAIKHCKRHLNIIPDTMLWFSHWDPVEDEKGNTECLGFVDNKSRPIK